MDLLQWAWEKKRIHGIDTSWLFGKEKILGTVVSKEGHADCLLRQERMQDYQFSWKRYNYKPFL